MDYCHMGLILLAHLMLRQKLVFIYIDLDSYSNKPSSPTS